jgi:hypothetical protein
MNKIAERAGQTKASRYARHLAHRRSGGFNECPTLTKPPLLRVNFGNCAVPRECRRSARSELANMPTELTRLSEVD